MLGLQGLNLSIMLKAILLDLALQFKLFNRERSNSCLMLIAFCKELLDCRLCPVVVISQVSDFVFVLVRMLLRALASTLTQLCLLGLVVL